MSDICIWAYITFFLIAGFSRPIYLFQKGKNVFEQETRQKHKFYDFDDCYNYSDAEELSD